MGGRNDNRETQSFDLPGASGHWAVVETSLGSKQVTLWTKLRWAQRACMKVEDVWEFKRPPVTQTSLVPDPTLSQPGGARGQGTRLNSNWQLTS